VFPNGAVAIRYNVLFVPKHIFNAKRCEFQVPICFSPGLERSWPLIFTSLYFKNFQSLDSTTGQMVLLEHLEGSRFHDFLFME
jgi:hypothetical protein